MSSDHRLFSINNISDTDTDAHNDSSLNKCDTDNYNDFNFIDCSNHNRDSNKHGRIGLEHCK